MNRDLANDSALKRDRDRFVGFAFAAADTLVELDRDRRIRYVVGAALTDRDDQLVGRDFIGLLGASDRTRVAAELARATEGDRVPAMKVGLDEPNRRGAALVLSGRCLPDLGGHYYLALRPDTSTAPGASESDAESGLIAPDAFHHAVAGLAAGAANAGILTLIGMEGLEDLRDRLSTRDSGDLMRRIGGILRDSSLDGATAGRTGEETFGMVHDPAFDLAAVVGALRAAIEDADPSGSSIGVRSTSVVLEAAELSRDEAAKAVLYAMRKFGATDDHAEFGSLSECCAAMVSDSVDRLARFKRTLSNDAFNFVVQPVVEIATRRVQHLEVLSRFAEDGETSPQAMIAFAEEMGLVCEFDLRVVARTIASIDAMRAAGKCEHPMAVNLSMRSIATPRFVDDLHALLRDRADLRSWLLFEITETARIKDLAGANRIIQSLRALGHEVCLDDFGAGAAAFQYLRAFEVDAIKIDGAYVTRALGSARSRSFLKAMAGLCLDMGVAAVGEMVEDERTAGFLESCGVRFGQGYYFGRPVPLGSLIAGDARAPSARRARATRRVVVTQPS